MFSGSGRWLPLLGPVALLVAVWHVAVVMSGSLIFPTPGQVAVGLVDLARQGLLLKHLVASLFRVTVGYLLAVALAVPVGMLMGWFGSAQAFLNPLVQGLRPISPIAWIPLAILWFGIGEQSKVYIIFLGAFFPVIINTIDGIRQTDHKFVEVARILTVPRFKFVRQVVIPGALPAIMTGLRVGLMVAWMCVVAAELIAASSGIGYLIMDARQLSQSDVVLVGMITIGVIGKLMDSIIKRIERRLIGWKAVYAGD
jgi:sulfonate transport system permease protein